MATKYWHLQLKGERAIDEVRAAVGKGGGVILRVHVAGGQTEIFLAGEKSAADQASKALASSAAKSVSAEEVARIG